MADSNTGPTSQPARAGGFWTFWTTLPGILTGVAALITAIVGLITVLNRQGRERSATASDKAIPVQSAPTSQPTAASSPPPAGVFAQGRLAMKSPDRADLEKGIAGTGGAGGVDLYLYCNGVECLLNPMGSLLTVTEAPGDKASCIAALKSRREGALRLQELTTGQRLCVQTAEGHVGALEILGLPESGSSEFVFSYTLFR
jgi:hypothetical protein